MHMGERVKDVLPDERKPRETDDEAWTMQVIREAKEEQKKQPLSPEALVAQLKSFARLLRR